VLLLERGLSARGYIVRTAPDGATALELAGIEEPDVTILDLGLPDIDGVDVCRAIRAVSEVPVIVVSARGEVDDRILGLHSGADDYLVKPYDIGELLARVHAVYRRRRPGPGSTSGDVVVVDDVTVECIWIGQEGDLFRETIPAIALERADDDDDLQMTGVISSLKCPLTLRTFKEPYSNKKCKHTFEKSAILQFHRENAVSFVDPSQGGRRGRGVPAGPKQLKCPERGCDAVSYPTLKRGSDLTHCRCWRSKTFILIS
jgi:CheY-like chemotaxis protein